VLENGAVVIDVLANDTDVDGDALSIVLGNLKSAMGATLKIENGKVVYAADAEAFDKIPTGQSVTDSFTYRASDGHGGLSDPVTVTVKVVEAGDNQTVYGTNKAATFIDSAGHDTVYYAGNGGDVALGLDGSDTLVGGNGKDILFGGAGADILDGGNANDILVGGPGYDILTGGNGQDSFVITTDSGTDFITDFRGNLDTIVVGYGGPETAADVSAFIKAAKAADGFAFADVDLDGNGSIDAVSITGGALGGNTVLLGDWTVATLIGQGYLSADHHVKGGWLLAGATPSPVF
jgi:hypothetical protein